MSTTRSKRKRARKACTPCHQRKRKCDGDFPCSMCNTYGYECDYGDGKTVGSQAGTVTAQSLSKRIELQNPNGVNRHITATLRHAEGVRSEPTIAKTVADDNMLRYAASPASTTFPYSLSADLGSTTAHSGHTLAWNFGIRSDEVSDSSGSLVKLISERDLEFYSNVFFSTLGSVCDVVDLRIYTQRCRDHYSGQSNTGTAFSAVAAGIAALGSLISAEKHPRESELVQYAKSVLDDPGSMRVLLVDHVIAWGLRLLYLRSTSRPNNAWIASCTALHLCEGIGLHDDNTIKKLASAAGAAALGHDADRLRRVFWVTWAAHVLISYEFDRSPVHFRTVTCGAIVPTPGSMANQFVQLVQVITVPSSGFQTELQCPTARDELFERVKALKDFQFTDPFLQVTKIDVALCFYRRIYQLKTGISDDIVNIILECGVVAMSAAEQLARQERLFWNVIGSVFHFACALLAMDTAAASVHIGPTFQVLENLVKAADTAATRDALSMARHLLGLLASKKRMELSQLESIQANEIPVELQPDSEVNGMMPNLEWSLEWDQFLLDPYFQMSGYDFQT